MMVPGEIKSKAFVGGGRQRAPAISSNVASR